MLVLKRSDKLECPRCGGPPADNDGGYCFNCLCSYRRNFGQWPFLTPRLKLIFGVNDGR